MPIPLGAFQRRLHATIAETNKESASAESKVRGIVVGVYSITDLDLPPTAQQILEANPGICAIEVHLLNGKKVVLPLDCSPDEKEMIYGNNANMRFRPVEVRYLGSDIANGKVYFRSDPLTVSLSESEMPRALDVFGAMS
jgi:hypothetical protein